MDKIRLPSASLSKIKQILHMAQAAVIVLCLILTIAVFASSGKSDGRTGWYFGLCWLSLPVLIYLTMVPMWPRARKFANIYAFVSLDGFMAVAWLTAWSAVTDYVVSGKGKGDVENATGCNNFKFGSANRCRLSETTIVFGVVVMLLFVGTSLISFKAVWEYKRTGILPQFGGDALGNAGPLGGVKSTGTPNSNTNAGNTGRHDDEAFDSNMNLRDNWEVDEYDHDEYNDRYGGRSTDARQGRYGRVDADEHGDEYEQETLRPAAASPNPQPGNSPYASHAQLGEYADDHDLSNQRPASSGGPLGGTGYSGYNHGGHSGQYGS